MSGALTYSNRLDRTTATLNGETPGDGAIQINNNIWRRAGNGKIIQSWQLRSVGVGAEGIGGSIPQF